jgi:hypothetical protein
VGILSAVEALDPARNEADAFTVLLVVIAVVGDRWRPCARRPAPAFRMVRARHLHAWA